MVSVGVGHGDVVELAPDLPPADIVTLDSVIGGSAGWRVVLYRRQ